VAETTTAVNACNVGIHLANHAGVMKDISGSANRADLNFSQQIGEFQVFGGGWVKRLVCKKDATANVTVLFTTTTDEGWAVIKDWWDNYNSESRRMRIFVPEEAIGSDEFDGLWLISTLNVPLDGTQAGPVMVALSLVQTDGIAIHTVAT